MAKKKAAKSARKKSRRKTTKKKSAGKKGAKKKATKKAAKPKRAARSKVVATQREVADHFKVSLKTVQSWALRGMPGARSSYDLNKIEQWRQDTFRHLPLSEEEQKQKYLGQNDARQKLLEAQADRERANANMAQRQDMLEEGAYTSLDDLNLFMGEFFTEFRQLMNRMNVEMAAGYGPKLKKEIREELQQRHDLILQQMHDWVLRTEDLQIESKGKPK